MTIRTRLLVVAAVPALALGTTTFLLRSGASGAKATLATAVAGLGVLLTVALAVSVARTITEPLARLGEAAERASHLQNLVEALRRPGGGDKDLALTPLGLPPGSEIGNVAHAFDEFQGAAARLAVGQAALLNKTVAEKGTVEVFVNLARRMQGLVDHQIEFLDGLEAEEQDADTLDNLFRLDQLATRVRRNAESLLTLAGAASARSWERPLPMSDVVRAGMAEVEDIGRVDLLLDDNAAMLGNVAADAAHLLSELLENATRWSPPDTRVEVSGTPAAGGYVITIEDSGIGMPDDALAEANHILTGPPLAEATVARALGLVVAGRLGRRLGIVVRLAKAGTGGIEAKVLVPPTLMVAADDTLALEDAVAGPARTLPFALARQEKRARISSQRSRGARPVPGSQQADATITRLPERPPAEPSAPVDVPEPAYGSHWDEAPAAEPEWRAESSRSDNPAPVEPEWPAESSRSDNSAPVEPEWPAASEEWRAAEQQSWSPPASGGHDWPDADLSWPAAAAADDAPSAGGWTVPADGGDTVTERVASAEPEELPQRYRASAEAGEPIWPEPMADEPAPAPLAAKPAPPAAVAPTWEPAVASPVRAVDPEPVAPPAPVRAAEPEWTSPPAPPAPPTPAQSAAWQPVSEVPALPVRPPRTAPAVEPPATAARPAPQAIVAAAPPTPPHSPAPPAPPLREPSVAAAPPLPSPPVPPPASASEPPQSIRPTPSVRPARFASSSSRSLAGAAASRTPVPSAEAKEDEYRRHLERATAAGLVRRVPKASLPQDTGGGAKRAPKTGGDQPVAERLPDEVRSLLSSYRSGVQRGRADGPSADPRTTTPQEQP